MRTRNHEIYKNYGFTTNPPCYQGLDSLVLRFFFHAWVKVLERWQANSMSYKWSERVNWHFFQWEGQGGDSPDISIPNVFLDYSESICCRKKPKTVLETRVKCLKKTLMKNLTRHL